METPLLDLPVRKERPPLATVTDKGRKEKLVPTHYEGFVRMARKVYGITVPEDLQPLIDLEGSDLVSDNILDTYLTSRNPSLAHLCHSTNPVYRSEYFAQRSMFSHALSFSRNKRVFMVEKGLTQRLLHTSIDKIDAQFVRSPFESLYVSLPYNDELLIPNVMTGEHKVCGFYIYSSQVDGDTIHTRSYVNGGYIKASEKFGTRDLHLLKVLAVGRPKVDMGDGLDKDDAMFYAMFMFKDGADLLQQVHEQCVAHCLSAQDAPYLEALMAFLTNLLLYISSPSAALERVGAKYAMVDKRASDKEKSKADAKNVGVSKISVISIGAGISVLAGMDGHYSETPLLARAIGCPRWLVRGHWRAQAFGAGRTQHRPQWIQPYAKGKGLGAEVLQSREYVVRGDE